jgi:hypothetical protein
MLKTVGNERGAEKVPAAELENDANALQYRLRFRKSFLSVQKVENVVV